MKGMKGHEGMIYIFNYEFTRIVNRTEDIGKRI
jgi:hypothetical protein